MMIGIDRNVLEIYYTILKPGMLTAIVFCSYVIHEVHGNIMDEFHTHIYCLRLVKGHKIQIGPDELVKKQII
jgi:energy-converting hydrogenase Eha subunit C